MVERLLADAIDEFLTRTKIMKIAKAVMKENAEVFADFLIGLYPLVYGQTDEKFFIKIYEVYQVLLYLMPIHLKICTLTKRSMAGVLVGVITDVWFRGRADGRKVGG
jgi:hypothetical protein